MSHALTRTDWAWDEYLAWEAQQDLKHELVDGRIQAMTGGSTPHDLICNNLRGLLWNALRGSSCGVHGPDLLVRSEDNGRHPDALIDCGVPDMTGRTASEPIAVFEVLSPSTAWIDQGLKLRDYDRVPSIRSYVLIAQREPRILHYMRDASGRLDIRHVQFLEGLDRTLRLPGFDFELPLATLYERVTFAPS